MIVTTGVYLLTALLLLLMGCSSLEGCRFLVLLLADAVVSGCFVLALGVDLLPCARPALRSFYLAYLAAAALAYFALAGSLLILIREVNLLAKKITFGV